MFWFDDKESRVRVVNWKKGQYLVEFGALGRLEGLAEKNRCCEKLQRNKTDVVGGITYKILNLKIQMIFDMKFFFQR